MKNDNIWCLDEKQSCEFFDEKTFHFSLVLAVHPQCASKNAAESGRCAPGALQKSKGFSFAGDWLALKPTVFLCFPASLCGEREKQ